LQVYIQTVSVQGSAERAYHRGMFGELVLLRSSSHRSQGVCLMCELYRNYNELRPTKMSGIKKGILKKTPAAGQSAVVVVIFVQETSRRVWGRAKLRIFNTISCYEACQKRRWLKRHPLKQARVPSPAVLQCYYRPWKTFHTEAHSL